MTGSALRALLVWLLAMLLGAVVVWNTRFSADVSFFLPSRPTAEQAVMVDQLREGAVSRLLMLSIEGGDAGQRARASRALRTALTGASDFATVQNGEAEGLDAARDVLLRHRYLLSTAVTPERFSVEGLRGAVNNSIDLLSSSAGLLFKPYLARDPTGELVELVSGLNAGVQPDQREGVWASRDGERAMLLVQTRALGSDTDGQAAAIALIRARFAEATALPGLDGLRLQMSGPGMFAVQSRATIQQEVTRLSLMSALAIALLLGFIYRRTRLLLLTLVPVLSGTLAGVVVVGLVHGTVFGITVGFGAALIGEAVDYAIYYFVQSGRLGQASWRERYWPTIRLGVLTSLFGFGALLFSGFPGLAQLGLYALTGVLTAAVVTRYLLPRLAGPGVHLHDGARLGRRLRPLVAHAGALRWPLLALVLVAAAYLAQHRNDLWYPNLSALSTVSASEAELDGRLRADLGAPDARYMAVITAPDRESALQAAERAGAQLQRLVDAGLIGGFDSPAPGDADTGIPVQAVRDALAGSGALFIDLKGEFDALYGEYIQEAIQLSAAGCLAIVVALAFVLRSGRRLAGVMLPLVMAVMLVVAGLHASGERLHLLHLVGMLLTVAVGSNYALFFDRLAVGEPLDDETLLSIAVASVTTVIGFGVLAVRKPAA
jgi:predicted exporter